MTTELEPLEDSPELNRLLLRNARRSFAEISEITGIPKGEVAERLTLLLDNTDMRDDLYEEKLLLAEVGMLINDIRDRMSSSYVEDEGWASMARVQLQAIKTLMEQLDKRRKAIDGKLSVLTMEQAQLMAAAIRLAKERFVFEMEKRYPEVDAGELHRLFDAEVEKAGAFLEENAKE